MKHKGSVSEFSDERNRYIMSLFRKFYTSGPDRTLRGICRLVASSAAPRFFVSERRASEMISMLRRGKILPPMHSAKRRMYAEILKRVTDSQQACPGMPLSDAVFEVVNAPAPEIYISEATVRSIIYREMRMVKNKIRQQPVSA